MLLVEDTPHELYIMYQIFRCPRNKIMVSCRTFFKSGPRSYSRLIIVDVVVSSDPHKQLDVLKNTVKYTNQVVAT